MRLVWFLNILIITKLMVIKFPSMLLMQNPETMINAGYPRGAWFVCFNERALNFLNRLNPSVMKLKTQDAGYNRYPSEDNRPDPVRDCAHQKTFCARSLSYDHTLSYFHSLAVPRYVNYGLILCLITKGTLEWSTFLR